jgi:hypothetical protein
LGIRFVPASWDGPHKREDVVDAWVLAGWLAGWLVVNTLLNPADR